MGSGDTWGEASSLPLRDHELKVSLLQRSGVAQHIREKLGFRKEQNQKISGCVSTGTPGIVSVGLPHWGEPGCVHLLSVRLSAQGSDSFQTETRVSHVPPSQLME